MPLQLIQPCIEFWYSDLRCIPLLHKLCRRMDCPCLSVFVAAALSNCSSCVDNRLFLLDYAREGRVDATVEGPRDV